MKPARAILFLMCFLVGSAGGAVGAAGADRFAPPVPSARWIVQSNQGLANFGNSVATAGDVNGDGFDDVIVGAYFYAHGEPYEGAAFVFDGSAAGLSTTPSRAIEGNQVYANLGDSVGTAGDVDADGFDETIVGAYLYDNGQLDEGITMVFPGRA